MNEYDVTLKLLLRASADSIIRQLSGLTVARWLNVEISQVQTSRADLLGATADDELVHVELQSSNDSKMALRMAEYAIRIYREFGRFPKQIVLYLGEAPMRMDDKLTSDTSANPSFAFSYTLIDIRDLDTATLLRSPYIGDNLLAILTRFQDRAAVVREVLGRIAALEGQERRGAFEQFLIISGLRRLGPAIKQEAQQMPILNDIMDHEVIGPAIRQGLEQGLKQGFEEGEKKGRQDILLRQLEKRFGQLPAWVTARIAKLSSSEVDQLAIQLFDSTSLQDLFPE